MILCSVIMVAINILNLISKMKLDSFENMSYCFKPMKKIRNFLILAAQDVQEYKLSLIDNFPCKTESTIMPLYENVWVRENPYSGIFYAVSLIKRIILKRFEMSVERMDVSAIAEEKQNLLIFLAKY